MLKLFQKRKAEFFPFEDMRNVKQLFLTPEQYQFLVDRLKWGLEREMEDGGIITVYKENNSSRINEFYIAPDEFKTNSMVDMYKVEESEWYKKLLFELIGKQQKIGLYYHTHPLQDYGLEIHEEGCTARRTRYFPIEKFMEPEERKLSVAKRRLGDVIVEMLKGNKFHMHGYTPATKPYYEKHPLHGLELREVHSLEIIVPELNLKFDSFVP